MKILHLSKFYHPDPGGLESVVRQLAEGAADAGHEVRVVAATGSSWIRDPGMRVTEPPRGDVVVVRLPTTGIVWSQPIAPGYLAAARWPADVVHLHHPHPLADLAAILGVRRPLVITHHSDIRRRAIARPFYGPVVRGALKRAANIVVPTGTHIECSRELRGFEAKVRVIPLGVDVERFAPNPKVERPACFPSDRNIAVALFVGRLVGYKGLQILVDAVRGTDLHVVIVGSGPERAALDVRIERLGLHQQVVCAGEVPDAHLPAYYQAASYVVLPSVSPQEMFGITLIEAMATQRPIITTALRTGVREVNQPDVTGLQVAVGDAAELRKAMQRLANDPAMRTRMGEAGRNRVLERYTIGKMISGHLELYRELAG
ncbi:MAG TPA: glycosyltransferase [Gemmatimonadales bacterium]